jgi:hypothetical protein
MDFLSQLFASADLQAVIVGIIGLVLTFILNRAAGAFAAATGIQIEAKHREALHQAIMTSVESGMKYEPDVGFDTLKNHVRRYLQESVPDALTALTPGDSVLDLLIERYARKALAKLGEPAAW